MSKDDFPKRFEPQRVEKRLYEEWENAGLFRADVKSEKPPYSIVIPPPNITGSLHMGHALNNTLQDILVRYKRMCGYNVLWMPGTDHAGIATQHVVEKQLQIQGKDRFSIGREQFIEMIWKWKEDYGRRIIYQLKRLGASCDWERERFTMDEGLSKAVRQVFVQLYEEGLIYRERYIINWCPRCRSALSDLEVVHREEKGYLYTLRYPLKDEENFILIATTRPETMLGDTAVAVNPRDPRYSSMKGKRVVLPILHRTIPIIFDPYVDIGFGTGALKITPAHDFNDFEIGKSHGLEIINIMNDDGRLNENAGPFRGMDRFEAREAILQKLEREGLLVKTETYPHLIGRCYRCDTITEPYLSTQWFVRVKSMAEEAVKAVEEGKIRIIPSLWESTFFNWMENIKDWCISRQIWWGHRIPAWYCRRCGRITVSMDDPDICSFCSSEEIWQDEDVLDTWFSSALWPFSTLGWPEKTPELRLFYPTSTLVTSFDIIFFWVARMMMTGLKFMKDIPFREVYIHALIRDDKGVKMSKTKGNVIDPLEMMDKYGTDALRFTLTALAVQGRDIRLSEKRLVGYRNFINKIWNSVRFALPHFYGEEIRVRKGWTPSMPVNIWLFSHLSRLIKKVRRGLENYRFNESATALYDFIWHRFCDWYLEMVKVIIKDPDFSEREKDEVRTVMYMAIHTFLRLLHPIMPFVTEELWHHLPGTEGYIMVSQYPSAEEFCIEEKVEEEIDFLIELISGIRRIRTANGISPGQEISLFLYSIDGGKMVLMEKNIKFIRRLTNSTDVRIYEKPLKDMDRDKGFYSVEAGVEVFIVPEISPNLIKEYERLVKELKGAEEDMAFLRKKLSDIHFLEKAPPAVVDKVRDKLRLCEERYKKLSDGINALKKVVDIGMDRSFT